MNRNEVKRIEIKLNVARTSLDFPGLLIVFVEVILNKVILDHKKSYLVYFENFNFLLFFHLWTIFAKN
jgi:hypothetical protein